MTLRHQHRLADDDGHFRSFWRTAARCSALNGLAVQHSPPAK